MKTTPTITLDGVTRTVYEWARVLNMSPSTIRNRLELGWDPQTALTAPAGRPPVSKHSAEMILNEMTRDQLPGQLASLVPAEYRGKKLGEFLRDNHRDQFDKWFMDVYVRNHLKSLPKHEEPDPLADIP